MPATARPSQQFNRSKRGYKQFSLSSNYFRLLFRLLLFPPRLEGLFLLLLVLVFGGPDLLVFVLDFGAPLLEFPGPFTVAATVPGIGAKLITNC